jgi:hypothetical protein
MTEKKSKGSQQVSSRTSSPARRGTKARAGNGKLSHDQIAQRAYEIYLARGAAGDPVTDWLQAERELAGQG